MRISIVIVVFLLSAIVSGEEQTGLIRVKPANIGPKEGKGTGLVETPASDISEAASSSAVSGTLEIIFDASNSMNAKIGGIPKIRLAKEAMYHLLDILDDTGFQTGFRVFGHDQHIDREDRQRACVNSELVVPIGKDATGDIRSRVPSLVAWGRTPIAYSLECAGEDLDSFLEDNPMVLLISDGVESCDGDPLKVIADLHERGIKFQTHVIGFDLKPEEKKALQDIATLGGGIYYDAANYGELLRSLDRFVRNSSIAAPPEPPVYLNPVEGGSSFEEAVEISAGNYTIRQTLKKGEFAWFRVPSSKAQRVAVRAKVQGAKMIRTTGGKLVESPALNGGTTVQFIRNDRPDRAFATILVGSASEIGDWKRTHVIDVAGEGSVFRVGSDHSETSPNALLEVIVQEAGDLYEGFEAPDNLRSSELFDVPLNDTFYGHIGAADRKDAYRITLGDKSPEKLKVTISFSDVDEPVKHRVEFFDADSGKRLYRSGNETSSSEHIVTVSDAENVVMVIHDNLANSILRTYMNSYEVRISDSF